MLLGDRAKLNNVLRQFCCQLLVSQRHNNKVQRLSFRRLQGMHIWRKKRKDLAVFDVANQGIV
jgi:hypothetical protein